MQIMINKINQRSEVPRSRLALSRNHKNRQKITQFVVHKMIKQSSQVDITNNYSSYVLTNIIPKTIHNQSSCHKGTSSLQRKNVKTESSYPKVQVQVRQIRTRSRWYCEPNLEIDGYQGNRDRKVKNYRVIMPDKSDQFKNTIAQNMKKMVKNSVKEHLTNSQQSLNIMNFGLNITQIKTICTPNKQSSQKHQEKRKKKLERKVRPKISIQQRKNQKFDLDLFLESTKNQLQASETFSPVKLEYKQVGDDKQVNNKELVIKKLDENNKFSKKMNKREQQTSSFQKKIYKMYDCLNIILNSFHCRFVSAKKQIAEQNPEIKRKEKQKYFFYIGPGNNSNLLRSLMRKRSWWAEVDSIGKANFVWTQLRVANVLEKMQKFKDESWTTDVVPFEQLQEQNMEHSCNMLRTSCKKSNSTNMSETYKVKQSSLSQLFHQKQSKNYHSVLDPKQSQLRLQRIHSPQLMHNHYEHNYMFGNKNALYYNISTYCQFTNKNLGKIVPLTFYLQKGNKKSINDFQKVFTQYKTKKCVWILKPAQNSNRGMGIQVTDSFNFIKSKLNFDKKLIVQYYLKHLLLYNGRKFDIRTFMICTTINGRHKFYWYDQGYIRTSSELYDLTNLKDQMIHLTNDAIQKNGDSYGKYQQGNKLSYSQFQRYLDSRFPKQNILVSSLHDRMKEMAQQAITATYCRIDPDRKKFSFELFGLDFIIDSHFKPYLIEINTNPCLELCSSVLERLIPRMMENMFRISIDPIFRPNIDYNYSKSQSYYLYDQSFLDRNKFTLIFDQKYDCNFEWEERCRKMRGLEWSNDEQEQYTDEGALILVDY